MRAVGVVAAVFLGWVAIANAGDPGVSQEAPATDSERAPAGRGGDGGHMHERSKPERDAVADDVDKKSIKATTADNGDTPKKTSKPTRKAKPRKPASDDEEDDE
jgi:hypothetical protein